MESLSVRHKRAGKKKGFVPKYRLNEINGTFIYIYISHKISDQAYLEISSYPQVISSMAIAGKPPC